ncbi:unnamed protein product, partial [Coregonus sp. 'balchen']
MVDLFIGRSLVCNNRDRVEYDTEREVIHRLQNRILLLFFGSADCQRCQEFVPTLKDFFKRLTDEFYVERSAQLVLLYISLDQSEEQLESLLKELPKRCLFLTHDDPYRRNFMLNEEFDDNKMRSVTDPIRRLKYKVEKKKKKKRWWGWGGGGGEEEGEEEEDEEEEEEKKGD